MILSILACIALPILIYSNVLRAPFFFDDYQCVVDNPGIKQWPNLKETLFRVSRGISGHDPSRPLVAVSLFLNHLVSGLDVFSYHLVNLLLHIAVTILVFLIVRFLFMGSAGFLFSGLSAEIAALSVALIFASHPLNTEVVSYISHRSESMCTFFYLLAVLSFFLSVGKSSLFRSVPVIFFILALFSKQTAVTLPAVLLLADFLFVANGDWKEMVPRKRIHLAFWIVAAVHSVLWWSMFGGIGDAGGGAFRKGVHELWSSLSYAETQASVVLRYIGLWFFPFSQTVDHRVMPADYASIYRVFFAAAVHVSIISGAVYYWRKQTARMEAKLLLFSVGWFYITLSVTSSFLPLKDAMAERRVYLPGVALALLTGIMVLHVARWLEAFHGSQRKAFFTLAAIPILTFSVLTFNRNRLYQDPPRLWEESIAHYPGNSRAYTALGSIYYEQGELDRAVAYYQKAIELAPQYILPYLELGTIYFERKDFGGAVPMYLKVMEIAPDFAMAYNNLGNVYFEQKDFAGAMVLYQKAIELSPHFAPAYGNLGNIYLERQDFEKAAACYQRALELDPNSAAALDNLRIVQNRRRS